MKKQHRQSSAARGEQLQFLRGTPLRPMLRIILCMLLCVLLGTSCASSPADGGNGNEGTVNSAGTLPDDFYLRNTEPEGTTEAEPIPDETEPPAPETARVTEPVPETLPPETEPVTEEPAPKERTFEAVEEDYFADALFIGDSCTEGLRICSRPEGAAFYSGTSMTVFGIMDSTIKVDGCTGLRQLLETKTFGKIYLLLGINEIGYGYEAFVRRYGEVVEEIRTLQPDAILYLQNILCVTSEFEKSDAMYGKENMNRRNDAIRSLADGQSVFYLSVNDALANAGGNLPASYSDDGVHLKAEYYQKWHDYLLEHAIVP